jgi:hypothetical protein
MQRSYWNPPWFLCINPWLWLSPPSPLFASTRASTPLLLPCNLFSFFSWSTTKGSQLPYTCYQATRAIVHSLHPQVWNLYLSKDFNQPLFHLQPVVLGLSCPSKLSSEYLFFLWLRAKSLGLRPLQTVTTQVFPKNHYRGCNPSLSFNLLKQTSNFWKLHTLTLHQG